MSFTVQSNIQKYGIAVREMHQYVVSFSLPIGKDAWGQLLVHFDLLLRQQAVLGTSLALLCGSISALEYQLLLHDLNDARRELDFAILSLNRVTFA